jgi:CHAT domain-containing protein/tetratricopeptide (TPR) repeat protein
MEHVSDHRQFIAIGDIATLPTSGGRRRLAYLLRLVGFIATGFAIQSNAADYTLLEQGNAVERQLAGGESHEYRFRLEAGQYAKAMVRQTSIDVAVTVFGPDGNQVFAGDVFGIDSAETAELIAQRAGEYRLLITASEASAPPGRYTVTLPEVEASTAIHTHRIDAMRAYAEANRFRRQSSRDALLKAVAYLQESLPHWEAAKDLIDEAATLYQIGAIYVEIGDRERALEYTSRALPVAQASHDPATEAWALFCLGQYQRNFGDNAKAVEYYAAAVPLMRQGASRAGEARALDGLGAAYVLVGEKRKALDCFAQAIPLLQEVQERREWSTVANNMGVTYADLAEYREALEHYQQALELRRELTWPMGQAITLSNLGLVYLNLGDYQKALDALRSALDINRSLDNRRNAAVNLNNLGRVYAALGDVARALQFFGDAIELLRAVNDRWGLAHTLNYIGEIHADSGDYRKALTFHDEALSFARAVKDQGMEASVLNNLGSCYTKLGDTEKARDHFERALAIHRGIGDQRQLAATLRNAGILHREQREYSKASDALNEALTISSTIQDRNGHAATLVELARLEWGRGDLAQAQRRAEEAISAFEVLRTGIISPKLRASLFANARQVHELNLEALLRLHARRPAEGFDGAALQASERGRARSLLEMLAESGKEIRRGVSASLVDRELELERLISEKSEEQTRLLNGKHTLTEAMASQNEVRAIATELEQVQSKIRETSPQYAALTQPSPLKLHEIQTRLLDQDTVLLEYALGARKSFLFVVTVSSIDVFGLPARGEIEAATKRVYDLLTARNRKPIGETAAMRVIRLREADETYLAAAGKVSRMLLGPAVSRIQNKRLFVVSEGVLNYLPFAALPDPAISDAAKPAPLIANHEIIAAPSASVLAILRQQTAERPKAKKTIAILADPVFSANDARIGRQKTQTTVDNQIRGPSASESDRLGSDPLPREFVRLRFSRNEAEEIARLTPAEATLKALDFDASREMALRPDLGQYQVLHFATHSLLNNEHPELSGVVLSLVDRAGHPQNGILRLYDIYNLRLESDLVVLSACRTALGEEIKSEGLIGLTRGFFYAGAPRVVATLWEIDDRTTAEVMRRFYQFMMERNQRPAEALRAAQVAMWKTNGWASPYYWAAFTIQGEWR